MKLARLFAALLLVTGAGIAASLLTINKTPFESFNCSVDFTPIVGADGINLISVTSTNPSNGFITTTQIISASPAPVVSGDTVVFRVMGGAVNQTHIVSVKVVDKVTGETFEGQVTLTVSSAAKQ